MRIPNPLQDESYRTIDSLRLMIYDWMKGGTVYYFQSTALDIKIHGDFTLHLHRATIQNSERHTFPGIDSELLIVTEMKGVTDQFGNFVTLEVDRRSHCNNPKVQAAYEEYGRFWEEPAELKKVLRLIA